MNDITALAQRVKAAALKATPGTWRRASTQFNGITTTPFSLDGKEAMIASASEKRDAEFITAANPTNVLALVEALEAAEKRGTDMEVACELFAESKLAQIKLEAALEKAQQRIAELEASHSKLRETLAGIHNTIRTDGSYTPLAAILNAAKRAHEESAAAAGVAVDGE